MFPSRNRRFRHMTLGHDLLNGLVDTWPLNEQSDARLGIHAGLHLTDNATVTGADGVGSLASQFTNANSEYLSRADEAALSIPSIDFTVAAWVYLDSTSANRAIVSKYNTTGNDREYLLFFRNSDTRFVFNVSVTGSDAFAAVANNFGAPSTATWYFVTAWRGGELGISVNAGTADTATNRTPRDGASTFVIGATNQGGGEYHDGRIQRVGLWKRKLTANEITYLYNSGRGRDYPWIAQHCSRRYRC